MVKVSKWLVEPLAKFYHIAPSHSCLSSCLERYESRISVCHTTLTLLAYVVRRGGFITFTLLGRQVRHTSLSLS